MDPRNSSFLFIDKTLEKAKELRKLLFMERVNFLRVAQDLTPYVGREWVDSIITILMPNAG